MKALLKLACFVVVAICSIFGFIASMIVAGFALGFQAGMSLMNNAGKKLEEAADASKAPTR